MKLNLFGGVFIFEGTIGEFTKIYKDVDKLGTKLVGIQTKLNKDTLETQVNLQRANPDIGMRQQVISTQQRAAGLA
jgi:hypothetical protein